MTDPIYHLMRKSDEREQGLDARAALIEADAILYQISDEDRSDLIDYLEVALERGGSLTEFVELLKG